MILIFTHGDDNLDKNGKRSGILVRMDVEGNFGKMYSRELNLILVSCPARVTLITSACFDGFWHDALRTTIARADDEETLSIPISRLEGYKGGYFGEAL